uniref:Uncharacterized protein n=1 Tax=Opuntia streptacantha TaxID=393608 RepID=A0A7C8ZNY0_OPUST
MGCSCRESYQTCNGWQLSCWLLALQQARSKVVENLHVTHFFRLQSKIWRYFFFNMARLVLDDFKNGFGKGPWWRRLFDGYSFTTWMVVLNLGSSGLLVSGG